MVNIFQHTQYCEGRGYVNKRSLTEALTQEHATQRVQRDGLENAQQGLLNQAFKQTLQGNFQPVYAPPTTLITNPLLRNLFAPLQSLYSFIQQASTTLQQQQQALLKAFQQALRPPLEALQRLLANVGAAFFNRKADRNEHDSEKAQLIEDNQAAFLDPFSFITLKEPTKSNLSEDR